MVIYFCLCVICSNFSFKLFQSNFVWLFKQNATEFLFTRSQITMAAHHMCCAFYKYFWPMKYILIMILLHLRQSCFFKLMPACGCFLSELLDKDFYNIFFCYVRRELIVVFSCALECCHTWFHRAKGWIYWFRWNHIGSSETGTEIGHGDGQR